MQDEPRKHVDVIERCDCGSAHFCSVRYWRDDEWPSGYFEVDMTDRWEAGFFGRLRSAWRILTRGYCERSGVVLDEEKAARLVDALTPIAQAAP